MNSVQLAAIAIIFVGIGGLLNSFGDMNTQDRVSELEARLEALEK